MTWFLFLLAALVIIAAGTQLARYGDVIGEKSGLGRSWIGMLLLAGTTTLPELFSGISASAIVQLPDIAVGGVLGSCMFNLLILSMMDAVQPEPLTARAHQGHVLTLGLGLLLTGVAGVGLAGGAALPALGWVSPVSLVLIGLYIMAMRMVFVHEQHRLAREAREVAAELRYAAMTMGTAVTRYGAAAVAVIIAAIRLPDLAGDLARETGLGEALAGSMLVAVTTSLPEIVVALSAVRLGAVDLGVGNILGANLFNLLILGLDDVFYRPGPLPAVVDASHQVALAAVVLMNSLFLMGLTYRVMTKRFAVAWDAGAMAVVYGVAVWLMLRMRG